MAEKEIQTEYDWSWKREIKRSFKDLGKELFSVLCMIATMFFVLFNQTPAQLKALQSVYDTKNWIVLVMLLIGFFAVSFIIESVIRGIIKVVVFLIKLKRWR